MEPASKVSVPFTAVMRTRVSTSDKAFDPAEEFIQLPSECASNAEPLQVFPDKFTTVIIPCSKVVDPMFAVRANPAVPFTVPTVLSRVEADK